MNIKQLFEYVPSNDYQFTLKPSISSSSTSVQESTEKNIYTNIALNLKHIEFAYSTKINSDIMLRHFTLIAKNVQYKAFILFIDGMVDSDLINRFVLNPLMLRNDNNTFDGKVKNEMTSQLLKESVSVKKAKKFSLESYIYNNLVPQNNLKKSSTFSEIIEGVNSGNCALFVDTIGIAFNIDVKGFKQRSVDTPNNEVIIDGPQEAFVENIRINTSLLRRIINNENLIIETTSVGNISKTVVAICYMQNIANCELVNEVKYRVNNLSLDSLLSSGQLIQLIQETDKINIPNILETERPDKCAKFLLAGRIVIIVNGNPYAIVAPAVLIDFLSSPEDTNLKSLFANFLKLLRILAYIVTLLAPGTFVAVTGFHHEILPTELLFSILASREYVPFPIILELLLMEFSFELIRESGLRVPAPIGGTLGIVGALILGDAAVSAHLVSPILIIIVAITGLSSFAIPNFSFGFHLRVYRFVFTILGYIAGFLGIGIGIYVYLATLCSLKSFGVAYLSPFSPNISGFSLKYFVPPFWKQEYRNDFLAPKKQVAQSKYSMKWKKGE